MPDRPVLPSAHIRTRIKNSNAFLIVFRTVYVRYQQMIDKGSAFYFQLNFNFF